MRPLSWGDTNGKDPKFFSFCFKNFHKSGGCGAREFFSRRRQSDRDNISQQLFKIVCFWLARINVHKT